MVQSDGILLEEVPVLWRWFTGPVWYIYSTQTSAVNTPYYVPTFCTAHSLVLLTLLVHTNRSVQ